jgi:hypothetical protein
MGVGTTPREVYVRCGYTCPLNGGNAVYDTAATQEVAASPPADDAGAGAGALAPARGADVVFHTHMPVDGMRRITRSSQSVAAATPNGLPH